MPKLLEIAAEYAHLKGIEPKPVMIAMAKLIQICGDKGIQSYDSDYLIPRYARGGHLNNTGASATLCKFL
jgi:hypothetical protein